MLPEYAYTFKRVAIEAGDITCHMLRWLEISHVAQTFEPIAFLVFALGHDLDRSHYMVSLLRFCEFFVHGLNLKSLLIGDFHW